MDFNFTCPFCNQELTIDETFAGSEIECPSCAEMLIIPVVDKGGEAQPAREDRAIALPKTAAAKIVKPTARSLETAAKLEKGLRLKSFRHHEFAEAGEAGFDDAVSAFLAKQGVENVVSVHPIQYTLQSEGSLPVMDYGVVIVYKA
jgi:ribosomal protein S27E